MDQTAISLPNTLTRRQYITQEQALYKVLTVVQQEIYNTDVLKTANLHQDYTLSHLIQPDHVMGTQSPSDFVEPKREWNQYMARKQFQCTNGNTPVLSETNRVHQRLRACVNALKVNIGWNVPKSERIKITLDSDAFVYGFYPTFSEPLGEDARFLDTLTSADWSSDWYTPAQKRICYVGHDNEPEVLNPLWSGDYDVASCPTVLACGCDTYLTSDGTRVVDTRCRNGDDCERLFPAYHKILQELIPVHCRERGETLQPVGIRQSGSLRDAVTPLCQLSPQATECTGRHGTLHGNQAEMVEDLHLVSEATPTVLPGGPTHIALPVFLTSLSTRGQVRKICDESPLPPETGARPLVSSSFP